MKSLSLDPRSIRHEPAHSPPLEDRIRLTPDATVQGFRTWKLSWNSLSAGLLLGCALATIGAAPPAQPAPPPAAGQTNHLVIVSEGEARYSQTNVVWQRHVRAAEEGFYLECEKLTAIFNTNSVRTNITGTGAAAATNAPNTRFDRVIAETNVMIITRDAQIIGDHAVFYASNDLLYVTGELVIAANAQGSILCTELTIDRNANSMVAGISNTVFIGIGTAFTRTNAPGAKTNAPPARP